MIPHLRQLTALVSLFLISLVPTIGAAAQTAVRAGHTFGWAAGGIPGDLRGGASDVVVSPDGSTVFVVGSGMKDEVDATYDVHTIAYDAATGAMDWTAVYDGPGQGTDVASSITVSPDGSSVYITGTSAGNLTHDDYATIAYDASSGQQLWANRYDGPASRNDEQPSVAVGLGGGKVFVTGSSQGADSRWDIATIAYSAGGDELWARRYDGPEHLGDIAEALAVGPGGGKILVTGWSEGANTDAVTIAYATATGETLWRRSNEGPKADVAADLAVGPGGAKAFVTGSSGKGLSLDFFVIAYSLVSGRELWTRRYDGPAGGADKSASIATSADGLVLVTGTSDGVDTHTDFATVAFAGDGRLLWTKRYAPLLRFSDANGWDSPSELVSNPSGSIVYVTGGIRGTSILDREEWGTLAYSVSSGDRRWVQVSDPGSFGADTAGLAVGPGGSRLYVVGSRVDGEYTPQWWVEAYPA